MFGSGTSGRNLKEGLDALVDRFRASGQGVISDNHRVRRRQAARSPSSGGDGVGAGRCGPVRPGSL
jgi:hypothetical protein